MLECAFWQNLAILLIFNDLLQFFIMSHDTKGCSRFCMILRDNRRNLEVCICTPDTLPTRAWLMFHRSVEIGDDLLWKGHVCIWAILGESGNFADFQQIVSLFSHVSWQEQLFLLLSIISWIWVGSDWHWAILRKLTMVSLIKSALLDFGTRQEGPGWIFLSVRE